jgi:hypothetical protein
VARPGLSSHRDSRSAGAADKKSGSDRSLDPLKPSPNLASSPGTSPAYPGEGNNADIPSPLVGEKAPINIPVPLAQYPHRCPLHPPMQKHGGMQPAPYLQVPGDVPLTKMAKGHNVREEGLVPPIEPYPKNLVETQDTAWGPKVTLPGAGLR